MPKSLHREFKHILTAERQIHVSLSKSRMDRRVPLNPEVTTLLKDHCLSYNKKHPNNRLTPDDYVFFHPADKTPMTRYQLRKVFKQVQIKAGLEQEHFGCHSLRHFFALQYYLQSHDILLIKRLLGHKSLRATEVYLVLAASIEVQEKYTNPVDLVLSAARESNTDKEGE